MDGAGALQSPAAFDPLRNRIESFLKIAMIRLANEDVRLDGRVCRVGAALLQYGPGLLIDMGVGDMLKREELRGMEVQRLALISGPLPRSPRYWPIKYTEFVVRTIRRLLAYHPDVIHCHDLPTLLPAVIAGRLARAKVVYDSHELFTEQDQIVGFLRLFWGMMERALIRWTDRVIVASSSRGEVMRSRYHLDRLPLTVMNCPPARDSAASKPLLPSPDIRHLVLYQGGLVAGRGLEELVQAMKLLPDSFKLAFMGYGYLTEKLRSLVGAEDLEDRVVFLPPVPHDQIVNYAASASVGIVSYKPTCLNKYLCAPNKLFEYCQAGIPVAVANLPELSAFVETQQIGATFNPADPPSIASAICEVVSNPHRWIEGVRKVASTYTWENEELKLETLYAELGASKAA